MSIPYYKRKLSNIKFLYELFRFNIRLGQICENGPKKYRNNYADHIIKTALKALQLAQYANSIYLSKDTTEEEFNERERCFKKAISLVDNIATTADIYLEFTRSNGVSNDKVDKREEEIGTTANEIIALLQGVLKSDKERYKKYKR